MSAVPAHVNVGLIEWLWLSGLSGVTLLGLVMHVRAGRVKCRVDPNHPGPASDLAAEKQGQDRD